MSRSSTHTVSVEAEASLNLLRRSLVKAIESLDAELFEEELKVLMKTELASIVLMSGLGLEGKTALHLAIEYNFTEAVNLLLATEKIDLLATAGETGWTVLHSAIHLQHTAFIWTLLGFKEPCGSGDPQYSCHHSVHQLEQFRNLLCRHTTSPLGATALHMAVRRNSLDCARALLEAANDIHRRLAETVVKINSSDACGKLEEIGPDKVGSYELCNLKDRNGDAPLHLAISNRNYEMIRLLCSYGAQPRHPYNHRGQAPLVLAKYIMKDKEMTRILINFDPEGASPTEHDVEVEDPDEVKNCDSLRGNLLTVAVADSAPKPIPLQQSDAPVEGLNPLDETPPKRKISCVFMSTAEAEKSRPYLHRLAKNLSTEISNRKSETLKASNGSGQLLTGPKLSVEVNGTFSPPAKPSNVSPMRPRANSVKLRQKDLEALGSLKPLQNASPTRIRQTGLGPGASPMRKRSSISLHLPGMMYPAPLLDAHQVPAQPLPPKPIPLRARRRASMMDANEYYPMASPRRGIAIIINSMTYWHPKFQDRGGCDKDEKRIEKVLCGLGFLVKVLRNLSSGEIHAQLKHLGTATDHSVYDCFVAVVMAHGGVGEIYGVDGEPFPVQRLTEHFTADKCKSLAGKPKLFFIQACRGDEYQLGYAAPSARPSVLDAPLTSQLPAVKPRRSPSLDSDPEEFSYEPAILAAKLPRRQRLVPAFADFLLSFATKAGFKAQRDPREGSIYIQSLCKQLEKNGRRHSLLDIVTVVHREVSEMVFREATLSSDGEGTVFLQTPECADVAAIDGARFANHGVVNAL